MLSQRVKDSLNPISYLAIAMAGGIMPTFLSGLALAAMVRAIRDKIKEKNAEKTEDAPVEDSRKGTEKEPLKPAPPLSGGYVK